MNDREFFNSIADKWDTICEHDCDKIRKIIGLSKVSKGSAILDIGTGTGVLIPFLLERFPSEIIALDVAENMIARAEKKIRDKRVSFVVSDLFNYGGKRFDHIFLYSVYPHFPDKKALFEKTADLLKPKGTIVIAHSESREAIDRVHSTNHQTQDHMLSSAHETSEAMSKWFDVVKVIDDNEMYYLRGVLKAL